MFPLVLLLKNPETITAIVLTFLILYFILYKFKLVKFGYIQVPPPAETGVSGIVTYNDNTTPLVGATVQVTGPDGALLGSGIVGGDGSFKALAQAGEGNVIQVIFAGEVVAKIENITIVQGQINNIGAIGTSRTLTV
jgi:hypothetical protein